MKALLYLNKFFYKYKYRLLFGVICTIVARILSLYAPQYVRESLNVVEKYLSHEITDINLVKRELFISFLIIIGTALLSAFFTFWMRQMIIVVSRYIEYDLKNEIFEQYERLSLGFYKKNRIGDLMNRISEDVTNVRSYFGPAIMYSINMITLFVIVITYMLRQDHVLTLYTLLPLPVLSISIYILSRVINKRSRIRQEYLSKLTAFTQEFFSGINVIKAYGIEKYSLTDFNELADTSKEKNISLYKANALFGPLMILLIGASNTLVIFIGGLRYINGQIENIGIIAEFMIYVNMLTWPVAALGWITSIVQVAEASQKRINEFLLVKPDIKNATTEEITLKGQIAFRNVTFQYEDTNITALKNVSFTIDSGKTLAILGRTGSGKSTIAQLIARLYDVDTGEILIDNKPIRSINVTSLREQIGFVPQEAFLFSDTIRNNIKFGNANADDEAVVNAAKTAHIHNNIMDFTNQYDTIVGERGVTLSGGQKQRVSIARAIIKDPVIYIFDDCLSAVDTETEEIILNNLQKASKNKTTIIISHRVSTVKNADHIIVLDKGTIVQEGNHQTLINKTGYYQLLYNQQLLEQARHEI
ncbi:MAG: ABC transporter ATP-binding protein [Flavobacteriaceae bacterium]|nr:ABC transporter ATP-binding protein [Flavobacteriaceae bacterium]